MVEGRTVAIFALDYRVFRRRQAGHLLFVAIFAVIAIFVFVWEGFPVLLVAQPMKAEGVTSGLDAEITGNIKRPHYQDEDYDGDDHIEWSPDVTFHCAPLSS